MSVSTISNWNFQNINENTCLTGNVQSGNLRVYKIILENEIINIDSVARGLYVSTSNGDFFCKYSEIGISFLGDVKCDTGFEIIKDICIFEKEFLQDKSFKNLLLSPEEKCRRFTSEFYNLNLIEKLIIGLFEKINYYNEIIEDNSCRIILNSNEACNSIVLKIQNQIFIDDYAKMCFRRESLKIIHQFSNFKISYLLSNNDLILLEIPDTVKKLQIEKCDDTICLQLLKTKGDSVILQDTLYSINVHEVL